MGDEDLRFWGQGTWTDDTFCDWPQCKRQHPMVGDNVRFLGCYFNDRGVNPMHDEWFAPMGPESAAFLKVAREEGPDLVVSLHSHESKPAVLRPAYVPDRSPAGYPIAGPGVLRPSRASGNLPFGESLRGHVPRAARTRTPST